MQITLNDQEARTLRNLIHDYVPALRRQHAATDLPSREIKDELHARIVLCERLAAELERGGAGGASTSR